MTDEAQLLEYPPLPNIACLQRILIQSIIILFLLLRLLLPVSLLCFSSLRVPHGEMLKKMLRSTFAFGHKARITRKGIIHQHNSTKQETSYVSINKALQDNTWRGLVLSCGSHLYSRQRTPENLQENTLNSAAFRTTTRTSWKASCIYFQELAERDSEALKGPYFGSYKYGIMKPSGPSCS